MKLHRCLWLVAAVVLGCAPVVESESEGNAGAGSGSGASSHAGSSTGGLDEGDASTTSRAEDPGDTDWPAGFSPLADIGDGTLLGNLLLVAQTPDGPLYLVVYAQRVSVVLNWDVWPAHFEGASWSAFPGLQAATGSVGGIKTNEGVVVVENLRLPTGTHPFGDASVTVDVVADTRLYADELLCGFIDIEFGLEGEDLFALPFVAVPFDEIGADPDPQPACE